MWLVVVVGRVSTMIRSVGVGVVRPRLLWRGDVFYVDFAHAWWVVKCSNLCVCDVMWVVVGDGLLAHGDHDSGFLRQMEVLAGKLWF